MNASNDDALNPDEARVTPAIAFADGEGHLSFLALNDPTSGTALRLTFSENWIDFDEPLLFDYDGDGHAELILIGHVDGSTAPSYAVGLVASVRIDGIRQYAPTKGIDIVGVTDVDKDERPDLVTTGPYPRVLVNPDCAERLVLVAPAGLRFIAHSLQGGAFSVDDAVVRTAAREDCGARVNRLVSYSGSTINNDMTVKSVVCARFWGDTEEQVMTRVRQEFKAFHPTDLPCARSGLWPSAELVRPFAHASPPFRLTAR